MMTVTEIVQLFTSSKVLEVMALLFIFNIALMVSEILLDFFTHKKRRWKDTGANILMYFMREISEKFLIGSLWLIGLLPFYYWTPLEIPMTWWSWIAGIIAADFTYYWMHRLEHEHRILWAGHSVHHSSEDYNLTVALRLSMIEGLIEWLFLIPMVLLGFNPFQAIVSFVLVAQYQTWIHTERIRRLGWLEKVLNTPSAHRVHHGSNEKYLDKNYGGILIIWDRLFGTFQREEEEVVYGLTKNIETNNPVKINFIEYQNIWKDSKKCRTRKDRLRIIFGSLTWRPAYFEQKNPQEKMPEKE